METPFSRFGQKVDRVCASDHTRLLELEQIRCNLDDASESCACIEDGVSVTWAVCDLDIVSERHNREDALDSCAKQQNREDV